MKKCDFVFIFTGDGVCVWGGGGWAGDMPKLHCVSMVSHKWFVLSFE